MITGAHVLFYSTDAEAAVHPASVRFGLDDGGRSMIGSILLIYSTFKDYAAEAAAISALLRRLNPACRTVLDVACGTGEHAKRLAADGFEVDGLDLSPAFVTVARAKRQDGLFFVADMSDFHVQQRYDAVICTRHVSEVHELGLFTTSEMLSAFRTAGLDVEHDPKGLTDRGLFIGRAALC